MRELCGTPRIPGVAIAVSVVVDIQNGLSGVPEGIMRQGLKALKMGLRPDEYPEAVIICDRLSIGSAVKIPGIRTIGIAAQIDDQPALPLQFPCVAGIDGLLQSSGSELIVIIDGNNGVVYIDPDVETVIRYQSNLSPQPVNRVFLESEHLPAKTQDGRVVHVAAVVSSIRDVEEAISQGADSLVVLFSHLVREEITSKHNDLPDPDIELFETILILAAGKPLKVVLADPDIRLLELAERFATGHVEFVDISDEPEVMPEEEAINAVRIDTVERVAVPASSVARTKHLIRLLPGDDI